MKKITLVTMLLASFFTYSQSLPLDFEVTEDEFTGFNGTVASIVEDPDNASNKVLKFVAATDNWDGASLSLDTFIDLSDNSNNTVSFKIKAPDATTRTHLLKLEGGTSGATELNFTTNSAGWETINVDFGEGLGNDYPKITIFTDSGAGNAETGTYYFDDITGTNGAVIPTVTIVPPTTGPSDPPARDAGNVVSVYGDFYVDGGNNSTAVGLNNVTWDGSSTISEVTIDGKQMLKIELENFLGTELGSKIDASDMTHFHMDYWVADNFSAGQVFNPKWSNHAGGNAETDAGEYTLAISEPDVQTWKSIDVPLTSFANVNGQGIANRAELAQFLITVANTIDEAYVDNIYFYKENSGGDPEVALPIDFETATTWGDFDGGVVTTVDNPFMNSDNNSDKVGKMVKNAGQPHGGSSLVLSSPMDFENNNTFKMKVYSPRTDAKVLLKVENSGDGAVNFQQEVLTTVANAWETLSFDYSTIDATKSYDKIVLIFDNGTQGDGSANYTFYIDDIKLMNEDSGGGDNTTSYCETEVTHFGIAAETASAIKLTIANVDEQSMKVEIESANDDPVDALIVNNTSGPITGSPAVSAVDDSVAGKLSVTLTWTGTPPSVVELNILWSKESSGGNWQLIQTGNTAVSFDEDCSGGGEPTEPMAAAPTPTHDAEDVISLFSDAYTDVTVDTFRTDWSSGTLDDVEIAGNATKKYSSLNFVGIETVNSQVDASSMTHIHIDVWSPNFTSFGIKLVDFGANGAYQGGDDVEHQVNFDAPVKGEWVSYDIALSDFTGLTTRANLAQYVLVGQPTGSTTVYVDNIYFYNDGSLSTQRENLSEVSAFPNPVNSGLNLSSKDIVQNITIYNVLGKTVDFKVVNEKNINIDVSFLSPGVYILKYKTELGIGSLKFIREK